MSKQLTLFELPEKIKPKKFNFSWPLSEDDIEGIIHYHKKVCEPLFPQKETLEKVECELISWNVFYEVNGKYIFDYYDAVDEEELNENWRNQTQVEITFKINNLELEADFYFKSIIDFEDEIQVLDMIEGLGEFYINRIKFISKDGKLYGFLPEV